MTNPARPGPEEEHMQLEGKMAMVTGAGSGIGLAVAEEMARRGAAVACVDLSEERARSAAETVRAAGGSAGGYAADVSKAAELDRAVTAAVADLGALGIMVNNAGILDGYQNVDEMDEDIWRRVIDIDLTGVYLGCKRALQEMLPAGAGRIVNMASIAGLNGTGGGAAYIAAKHGVVGLTRQMAVVYSDRGVTVNCVCPGVIPTNLRENTTGVLGEGLGNLAGRGLALDDETVKRVIPAGVKGTVQDIAAAVCFLSSDDARYVSGHSLVVDGGLRAR
jgi:NAD(P)-dependent dehydrogenase (short-subunit alcohol dehydrogenase family)